MNKIILMALFICLNTFAKNVTITIESKPIALVDEKFLSFGVDTAQVVGSFWWDAKGEMNGGRGKNKTTPLKLTSPKLLEYAKELSPAYFRIGGSEADALFYNLGSNDKAYPEKFDSVLTKSRFKKIKNFIKYTGLDLFFTLNQGPPTWKDGKWQTDHLDHFFKYYSKNLDIPITFELGNEVFAYWAIFA